MSNQYNDFKKELIFDAKRLTSIKNLLFLSNSFSELTVEFKESLSSNLLKFRPLISERDFQSLSSKLIDNSTLSGHSMIDNRWKDFNIKLNYSETEEDRITREYLDWRDYLKQHYNNKVVGYIEHETFNNSLFSEVIGIHSIIDERFKKRIVIVAESLEEIFDQYDKALKNNELTEDIPIKFLSLRKGIAL